MRQGPVYAGGKTGGTGSGCSRCLRFSGKASVPPALLLFLLLAELKFPLRLRRVPTAALCLTRLLPLLPLELEGLLGPGAHPPLLRRGPGLPLARLGLSRPASRRSRATAGLNARVRHDASSH